MKKPLSSFTLPAIPPLGWIVLYCLCLWGPEYLLRDLWEPDEARYAYVAQEMLDEGHLLVPYRHGETYAHKPPLLFWINQLFAQFNGDTVTPFTSRIPSLLGAILSLYVTSRFAAALFGGFAPWTAPLLLSTSALFWKTNGMGQMDALLCGLGLMSIWLLYQAETLSGPEAARRRIFAFLCMGLAILTKGPVGLLIPLGSWIVFGSILRPQGAIRRTPLLWGTVLALVPVTLWILAMIRFESPPQAYLQELLFKQNVSRVTGEMGRGHVRPPWYFLENFFIDFLPWLLLFPTALWALFRNKQNRRTLWALLGWVGFVVLFFTLSATKRNLYVLSIYPVVSILTAAGWEKVHAVPVWAIHSSKRAFIGILCILGISGGLVPVVLPRLEPGLHLPLFTLLPSALLILGTATLLILRYHASPLRWLRIAGGGWAVTLVSVGLFLYPALNPIKSPHAIRSASKTYLPEGQPLLLYKMMGEIQALNANTRGQQIHDLATLRQNLQTVDSTLVVLKERDWAELQELPELSHATTETYSMGSKTLRWVAYKSPDRP